MAQAILRNGGVAPLIWHLMFLITLVIFAVQVALDFRNGLPWPARAALWLALPYLGVVAWVLVQGMAGLPPELAHSVWAMAPDGAQPAISSHPDSGGPVVLRFTCYAMLFWILLRTARQAPDGAIALVQAIALFSTALALYGMVSLATGYNLLLDADESRDVLRASLWIRNSFATVAVFGVLSNITAYMHSISSSANREGALALRDFLETFFSRAWVYAFGALVGLAALAMTLSRGRFPSHSGPTRPVPRRHGSGTEPTTATLKMPSSSACRQRRCCFSRSPWSDGGCTPGCARASATKAHPPLRSPVSRPPRRIRWSTSACRYLPSQPSSPQFSASAGHKAFQRGTPQVSGERPSIK